MLFRSLFTLGAFASIGLALAAVGVFSVMAYSVSLRTHEIGVRMALGARQERILGMLLLQGLRLVGAGSVIGLAAAYAFSKALIPSVPAAPALEPAAFVTITLVVFVVGVAACVLPARRGTKVDPLVALRCE